MAWVCHNDGKPMLPEIGIASPINSNKISAMYSSSLNPGIIQYLHLCADSGSHAIISLVLSFLLINDQLSPT